VETFPDGSRIHSNNCRVTPQAVVVPPPVITHFHETVSSGGRHEIQSAMDRAHSWFMANKNARVNFDDVNSMACVILASGVTFTLDAALHYRRGVRLVAEGATVITGEAVTTHLIRPDNNGGGGYNNPHYDWQIIGGTWHGNDRAGGFSVVHTSRFRLNGLTIKNTGGKKHHLEINSSGGARSDNNYNIEVLNCTFLLENAASLNGMARRAEDEAIQLDYAWGTTAAPHATKDGTVTNNVLISGCTFKSLPRAIGGHHWEKDATSSPDGWPRGFHSNILITGCHFEDINPNTFGSAPNATMSEGAVRAYGWNYVTVTGCLFLRTLSAVNVYVSGGTNGNPHGNPKYFIIRSNRFHAAASGAYHCVSGSAASTTDKKLEQLLVEKNSVEGPWWTTGYFIGADDTAGALPGVAEGAHYRENKFAPSDRTLAQQKAYNKYRAANSTNKTGVKIYSNTVSDGSVDNS
jgi:hypothetical protein